MKALDKSLSKLTVETKGKSRDRHSSSAKHIPHCLKRQRRLRIRDDSPIIKRTISFRQEPDYFVNRVKVTNLSIVDCAVQCLLHEYRTTKTLPGRDSGITAFVSTVAF